MRESCKSGSVGALGEQSPGATRQLRIRDVRWELFGPDAGPVGPKRVEHTRVPCGAAGEVRFRRFRAEADSSPVRPAGALRPARALPQSARSHLSTGSP
jgi:hypothetical protein